MPRPTIEYLNARRGHSRGAIRADRLRHWRTTCEDTTMATVYRISLLNGRFDHVATKQAAIARAIEMVKAEPHTSAKMLEKEWGVRFTRVSKSDARAVGLGE
jgi:hypothetical protein